MHTLLELIKLTKGIEYLIAIAFLIAFIAFWQWMNHTGKGLATRVIPLLIVVVGLGGLATTCISSSAGTAPPSTAKLTVDTAHYLANIYGPAKFAAHEMGPDVVSCQTCHHYSSDGSPRPCSECHASPSASEKSSKPGLKAAYHQRCLGCHKESFSGPMTCTTCHTEKIEAAEFKKVTAPRVPHSLLDRYGNCLTCHGPEGALPVPGNHSGHANVICLGCHKPS